MLRLLKRSVREPGYRQAPLERFGFYRSRASGELVWIHAVSAGETIAAAPLVNRLLQRGIPCLVTNMTPTGRERAHTLLSGDVEISYAPYDLPGSVARFLKRNQPRLLILIDTELWPNTLAACRNLGVKTMMVNGRMSRRSAAGYRRVPILAEPMFRSLDCLAVQTARHAERFKELGVSPGSVHVTGSIKFDAEPVKNLEDRVSRASRLVAGRPVLLGASTHEGEEAALLATFSVLKSRLPEALLILVPRHSHRTDRVTATSESAGYMPVHFSMLDDAALPLDRHVLIVDVMGELDALYTVSRVALVGGSLVPVGGHNLLEAVRAGCVVVMGSHLDNIEDIAQQFIDEHAMTVVQNTDELNETVVELMLDESRRSAMADAASRVLKRNLGALDRVEELTLAVLQARS